MLSSTHRLQGCFRMVRNGSINMDRVNFWIGKQLRIIGESLADIIMISDLIQIFLISLAKSHNLRIRMALINRNEFGPEAESNYGYFWSFNTHNDFRL